LDILAIAGAVLGIDINFLMISLLALTQPPERNEIVINQWQPYCPLVIRVHAASTVGFSATALSGEGAVLNGLGFLLLLEVLCTDYVPYFLERGHRYLRRNFILIAALINR
jgi:hypothetical protein